MDDSYIPVNNHPNMDDFIWKFSSIFGFWLYLIAKSIVCAHSTVFLAGAQNKNRVGREMVSKAIGWRGSRQVVHIIEPHSPVWAISYCWKRGLFLGGYGMGTLVRRVLKNSPSPNILYYCCLDAACIVLALLCIQLNHVVVSGLFFSA